MQVDINRDWLDYVEAVGSLASLGLAGVAAWFAWRSATDSKRSAGAAETTAVAAAEEAELSRRMAKGIEEQLEIERTEREQRERERRKRPVFDEPRVAYMGTFSPDNLTMGILHSMGVQVRTGAPVTRPIPVVLRIDFSNVGDKVASEVLASAAVPTEVGLLRSGPTGDHLEQVDLHAVDDLVLVSDGRETPAHRHAWRIAHMPPQQPEAIHLTLLFPDPGNYELQATAEHPEADSVTARLWFQCPRMEQRT